LQGEKSVRTRLGLALVPEVMISTDGPLFEQKSSFACPRAQQYDYDPGNAAGCWQKSSTVAPLTLAGGSNSVDWE